MHMFDCWCFIIAYSYIGEQVSEGGRRSKDKRPKHGCQIVVQSEQERVLKKQMRKEEKRLQRKDKDSLALQSFTTNLDVDVLRKIREQELQEAALRPLLTGQGHHYSVNPSELYPHVYDSLAGVLQSAAVVAGAKVGCFVV